MQAITLGPNRTGANTAQAGVEAMLAIANELTPPTPLDTYDLQAMKALYAAEAEAVGTVPPPASANGALKARASEADGGNPAIFLDKLGERLAFERTGTRLYDALIIKATAARAQSGESLQQMETVDGAANLGAEDASTTLERIRAQELQHFDLLSKSISHLGGDPTAMTPCADIAAVASMGLMQVLNDPRTTLAQCLNAMLTAELTDNAGWELLITLADQAGETGLVGQFQQALTEEQQHLAIVKAWLTALVSVPSQAFTA